MSVQVSAISSFAPSSGASPDVYAQSRSVTHILALMAVWAMAATSGLVFSEPCLTDAIGAGLIVLLPLLGMLRITQPLALMFMVWATLGILALIASIGTLDSGAALKHTAVSFFLYAMTFTVAGFIAADPLRHTRIIMHGWMVAALVAAVAGIAGYFSLFPGAELFTKFDRASGTFKDPNVFGPFLVPAILFALHGVLTGTRKVLLRSLAIAVVLSFAVFLSFSRGAWLCLMFAAGLYLVMLFNYGGSDALRRRIVVMTLIAVTFIAISVAALLQVEQVAALADQRLSTEQSYDIGPEGRFGGQMKAIDLALQHPAGLGAQQFTAFYHHEEPHNVYINMFLNTGWIGGVLYLLMVAGTLCYGVKALPSAGRAQPFLMIAIAAFAANAAEGVIIDTDHWRHFYVLMAIIWGIASAERLQRPTLRKAALRLPSLHATQRQAAECGAAQ